jgi:hypothetical protein
MRSVPSLLATLPFHLRQIVYLDRPSAPVRVGSMDDFPWTTIVLHLEQRCILFCCPFSSISTPFLRLQRCLMFLGMGSCLVMGQNLYWASLLEQMQRR